MAKGAVQDGDDDVTQLQGGVNRVLFEEYGFGFRATFPAVRLSGEAIARSGNKATTGCHGGCHLDFLGWFRNRCRSPC